MAKAWHGHWMRWLSDEETHLLLFLGDLDTHILLDEETGNTLIALAWVDGRKDQEDLSFGRVGNPHLQHINQSQHQADLADAHLRSIDDVVSIVLLDCSGLQRKSIGSRSGLRQAERPELSKWH